MVCLVLVQNRLAQYTGQRHAIGETVGPGWGRGDLCYMANSACCIGRTGLVYRRPVSHLLFAYGSLRTGEPDHPALEGATCLGTAAVSGVRLVDLGQYPALIAVGTPTRTELWVVVGELYEVEAKLLPRIDLLKQHPILFQRRTVTLTDGRTAQAYMMNDEQVRGRKRMRGGDWKKRFEVSKGPEYTVPRRFGR